MDTSTAADLRTFPDQARTENETSLELHDLLVPGICPNSAISNISFDDPSAAAVPLMNNSHPSNNLNTSESANLLPVKSTPEQCVKQDPPRKKRYILKTWYMECLLVLSATGFLLAIISILKSYHRQPQPSWSDGIINLNTFVALLATLMRNSIIMVVVEVSKPVISQAKWIWQRRSQPVRHLAYFDDASRGPWGAVVLGFRVPELFRPRNLFSRHIISVLLGCITTVLSLAISTSTQQSIRPVTCSIPVRGVNATLPIAHRTATVPNVQADPRSYAFDAPIKGLLLDALAGTTVDPNSFLKNCTTGNCTFPEVDGVTHRTAGFCTKCIETTALLQLKSSKVYTGVAEYFTAEWAALPWNMSVGPVLETSEFGRKLQIKTTWTLHDHEMFNHNDEMRLLLDKNATIFGLDILTTTAVGCQERIRQDQYKRSEFNCTQQIHGMNGSSDPQWNVVGATCFLYPCLKDMKAFVNDSVLTETVVHSTPMSRSMSLGGIFSGDTIPDLPCTINGTLYDEHNISQAPIDFDSEYYNGRLHSLSLVDGQALQLPMQCGYEIEGSVLSGLSDFWDDYGPADCKPVFPVYEPDTVSNRRLIACSHDTWWHSNLYNKGNATFDTISKTIEDLAVALTNAMRLDPITRYPYDNSANTVYGIVCQSTVCTSFDWPWLLYPAALVLLTAFALMLIIWVTATDEEDAPVWKSSILPLLYCGDLGTLKEIKLAAEKEIAVLEKLSEDEKWQIVLNEKSPRQDVENVPTEVKEDDRNQNPGTGISVMDGTHPEAEDDNSGAQRRYHEVHNS